MEHLIGASGHTPGATADVAFEAKVERAFAQPATCGAVSPFHRLARYCNRPTGHDRDTESPVFAHHDGHSKWLDERQMELTRAPREEEPDDLGDAIQAGLDALPTAPPEAVALYRGAHDAYRKALKADPGLIERITQDGAVRFVAIQDVFVACGWEIPQ